MVAVPQICTRSLEVLQSCYQLSSVLWINGIKKLRCSRFRTCVCPDEERRRRVDRPQQRPKNIREAEGAGRSDGGSVGNDLRSIREPSSCHFEMEDPELARGRTGTR